MEIKQDGEIEALNEYIAGLLECDVDEVYEKLLAELKSYEK